MAIQVERLKSRIHEALNEVKAPKELMDGQLRPEIFEGTQAFCKKLGQIWFSELSEDPRFLAGDPILLGSWAKDQLLPKSDLDFGFFTDNEDTRALLAELQKLPYQIRGRILDDNEIQKWPIAERLSFLESKPLTQFAAEAAVKIQAKMTGASMLERKRMVKQLAKDRANRHIGGLSFANVLEPQVKTGKGGLRDLQQCDHIFNLFPGLIDDPHPAQVLEYYRWAFLTIRLVLHRTGAKDFLQAALQPDVAAFFGFKDFRDFMREIHRGLSRVHFYSEFIFTWSLSPDLKKKRIKELRFETAEVILKALEKDASILVQYQVRRQMDALVTDKWIKKNPEFVDAFMNRIFSRQTDEKKLIAIFESKLWSLIDSRYRKLVGYNQHDQYHAYTADVHILNLLVGFKRMLKKPARLGVFGKFVRALSPKEEQILALACYYHDLAKGTGGDHEALGEEYVRKDSEVFGRSESLTEEVAWLVKNHLELSKAAFKEDPRAESTWKRLFDLQLNPARVKRLTLFTVLDIEATHPKAWTPWKEKLLQSLSQELLDPQRGKVLKQLRELEERLELPGLEVKFAEAIGLPRLKRDLLRIKSGKSGGAFAAEKVRGGYWVRYHSPEDKAGILVTALKSLFAIGASVQEAWVNSLPGIGVYDWFFVDSNLKPDVFEKRLALINPEKVEVPNFAWREVEVFPLDGERLRINLRGEDRRGLLLSTVSRIFKVGGEVLSARIQTWGEGAEDQLVLKYSGEPSELAKILSN